MKKSDIIKIIREEIVEILNESGRLEKTIEQDGFAVATYTGPAGTATGKHKIINRRQKSLAKRAAAAKAKAAYDELAAQAK